MKAVGYIVMGVIAALAVARKDKAEATKTHAEAEAIKSNAQNERDRVTIESLGVVIERLEQSYNTLSDRAAEDWRDLNARIEVMENERQTYIENAARLQRNLTQANDKIGELTKRITFLEGELVRKNAELDKKNADLDKKNDELAHKNALIEKYQREIADLRGGQVGL